MDHEDRAKGRCAFGGEQFHGRSPVEIRIISRVVTAGVGLTGRALSDVAEGGPSCPATHNRISDAISLMFHATTPRISCIFDDAAHFGIGQSFNVHMRLFAFASELFESLPE
jgi:hypothetical protein